MAVEERYQSRLASDDLKILLIEGDELEAAVIQGKRHKTHLLFRTQKPAITAGHV